MLSKQKRLATGVLIAMSLVAPAARATDIQLSDPATSLIDPDFDQANYQFTWIDTAKNLWLGYIDPATGSFLPPSGKALKVDTNAVPEAVFGNSSVFSFGNTGSLIAYTKFVGTSSSYMLATAQFNGTSWVASTLSNSQNNYGPIGGNDPAAGPIISYLDATNARVVYWRDLTTGASGTIPGAKAPGGRWVPNRRAIVYAKSVAGTSQIFEYSVDTGQSSQITDDAGAKTAAWAWQAPEYGGDDCLMALVNGGTALALYHSAGSGSWQRFAMLKPPSVGKYLWSPQPFVYNNKSYIVTVTSTSTNQKSLSVPTDIWLAGIDSANPFYRQVSDTSVRVRKNPKPFLTSQGLIVYFQVVTTSQAQMYAADSQLGPPQ